LYHTSLFYSSLTFTPLPFFYHPTQGSVVVFFTLIAPAIGLTLWAATGAIPGKKINLQLARFVIPAAVTIAAAVIGVLSAFTSTLVVAEVPVEVHPGSLIAAAFVLALPSLVRLGKLSDDFATSVAEAYDEMLHRLLAQQILQARSGKALDKLIDPAKLSPRARATLRIAMRAVKRFQDRLQGDYGTEIF